MTDVAAAQHEIPAMVSAQGVGLSRMEAGEMGLEEVFVELVGGAVGSAVSSGVKS